MLWKGFMLEQFVEDYSLWEQLTLEKFMEDCLLWETHLLPHWSKGSLFRILPLMREEQQRQCVMS